VEGGIRRFTIYTDIDAARIAAERLAEERGQAVSQENVAAVRSIYEAFAHHDGVTPFKHYAPDIEWDNSGGVDLVGGSTVYHGHDGVHALFHNLLQAFREFEVRPLELSPIADHVLVTVQENAVGRMSDVVVDRRHYAVWTLHNGMVTRVRAYLHRADALKAVGLEE
jgi:ketosteroid isomerase-like protein